MTDVGVRFTIPIWNETPRKRQALETQKGNHTQQPRYRREGNKNSR
mgnify:CR=1 FL=1